MRLDSKTANNHFIIFFIEPDYALECYEKALKESPNDLALISKMGQAYVDSHYFTRAFNYYNDAIKKINDYKLKLKVAELYMNLKQYDRGELILLDDLKDEQAHNSEVITRMKSKTEILVLLSKICERKGNCNQALVYLKDAMDNQIRVRKITGALS